MKRIESLLDSWERVARNDPSKDGLAYQKFEEDQASKRPLLHMPLDPDLAGADQHERRFVAGASAVAVMRTWVPPGCRKWS